MLVPRGRYMTEHPRHWKKSCARLGRPRLERVFGPWGQTRSSRVHHNRQLRRGVIKVSFNCSFILHVGTGRDSLKIVSLRRTVRPSRCIQFAVSRMQAPIRYLFRGTKRWLKRSRHRTISNVSRTLTIHCIWRKIDESRQLWEQGTRKKRQRGIERRMNGLGNVIRGPVIMTPLITDNYRSYRPRGVISTGPSPARRFALETRKRNERTKKNEENAVQFGCCAVHHGKRENIWKMPIIHDNYR